MTSTLARNIQSAMMADNNDAPEIPDDWAATCAIYGIDEKKSRRRSPSNNGVWIFEVPEIHLLERDIAVIRRVAARKGTDQCDPHFGFHVITAEQSPLLRVEFQYNSDTDELESATLRCVSFPKAQWPGYDTTYPTSGYTKWLEWLNEKVTHLVEEDRMSYVVCDFLEHKALDFFRSSSADEAEQYQDIVVCLEHLAKSRDMDYHKVIQARTGDEMVTDYKKGHLFHWKKLPAVEKQARLYISSHWQLWATISCPICFDVFTFADSFELNCQHLFCKECVSMYARTVVEEIRMHIRNPFLCPMTNCRQQIELERYIKKIVSPPEMKSIRAWQYDLKFPHSFLLNVCPKCKARSTIRDTGETRATKTVFCDECDKRWCEMCLVGNPAWNHDCNDSEVLRLCGQYRKASDGLKARADVKWPWLKEYSAARTVDDMAARWVEENASRCPQCRTGIERAEGCFHMQCSNCSTHFCYECGDELVPPYYGTHHCWLDRENHLT